MPLNLARCSQCLTLLILILAILYQCEIPTDTSSSDNSTFLITKTAIFQRNRTFLYQFIAEIPNYPLWYPNVARVEYVQANAKPSAPSPAKQYYRLVTKMALIGDVSSVLIIRTTDRPKRFVFSVDSWVLEVNSIALEVDSSNVNSTRIEWSVYTKRRSILFQYFLLPFARFYKNQIVREALFSLMMQIRDL